MDSTYFWKFANSVHNEISSSEVRWPENDPLHRLAALTGEVGELAEGYLKGHSFYDLEVEAIQVAATAFRTIQSIRDTRQLLMNKEVTT